MTEGSNTPTVEELQAQLLALQEKQTEQETKINSLSDENKKLTDDLTKAREINTKLFLRIPTDSNPEPKPGEEEDSFDKLLDDVFEKYIVKKKTD